MPFFYLDYFIKISESQSAKRATLPSLMFSLFTSWVQKGWCISRYGEPLKAYVLTLHSPKAVVTKSIQTHQEGHLGLLSLRRQGSGVHEPGHQETPKWPPWMMENQSLGRQHNFPFRGKSRKWNISFLIVYIFIFSFFHNRVKWKFQYKMMPYLSRKILVNSEVHQKSTKMSYPQKLTFNDIYISFYDVLVACVRAHVQNFSPKTFLFPEQHCLCRGGHSYSALHRSHFCFHRPSVVQRRNVSHWNNLELEIRGC